MPSKKQQRNNFTAKVPESDSVRFDKVEDTEFWLTPMNRIFLKEGSKVYFPTLRGASVVGYDDPNYRPSPAVSKRCHQLLRKQFKIRQGWMTPEEEKEAWTFN